MWTPVLAPGKLTLVSASRGTLRAYHQELAHFSIHQSAGSVLWLDGEHGMNPYDFAELNLTRGFDAEWGADRVLVKRCMTPFQWDTVLTKHLDQKLLSVDASLVLAAPYDALFSTDELKDWEQEDYVRYSLRHLRFLARRHKVPILLSVDVPRWWRTHPILAKMTLEAVDAKWTVQRTGDAWRALLDGSREAIQVPSVRQGSIWDYAREPVVPLARAVRRERTH